MEKLKKKQNANRYGTLRLANDQKIEGKWSSNQLVDRAIHTESNGERFEEFYRDGIAEGARKPLKRSGIYAQFYLT